MGEDEVSGPGRCGRREERGLRHGKVGRDGDHCALVKGVGEGQRVQGGEAGRESLIESWFGEALDCERFFDVQCISGVVVGRRRCKGGEAGGCGQ
jgi:hypothetical protein